MAVAVGDRSQKKIGAGGGGGGTHRSGGRAQ